MVGSERAAAYTPQLSSVRDMQLLYRAAEARAARLRLLVELGRDLVNARGLSTLLHLALERATAFSAHDHGSILLLIKPNGPLKVFAAVGTDALPVETHIHDLSANTVGRALQNNKPIVLDPRQAALDDLAPPHAKPATSVVCLPLITSDAQAIGVLQLKSTIPVQPLDADDIDVLALLASQVAAVVASVQLNEENEHLLEALIERERRLADLVGRLLVAQENERRRIAYELHDGLAQVTTSVHQHLQAFAARYPQQSAEAGSALDQALELAQRAVREARTVIAGLRPIVLDDFGLATAVRLELEVLQKAGWRISYVNTLDNVRLPSIVETALFRVAQEALNNVRKHTKVTRVRLRLTCFGDTVRLAVRDWGPGFAKTTRSKDADAGEHIGLLGMQERVALLGGTCRILSRPGAGTLVIVNVPLPQRNKGDNDAQ
ncbi:MAG: GAF domain-containing sensor histidine kinase [Chloroflexales bacterium]|nr:GAF domain-containing sensor histidine kinase [Chloroflexales bacterium]